jgi:hypothetical protein
MRPKARELTQYGGLPARHAAKLAGRLEESDPAGVILYMMDGPYRKRFIYRLFTRHDFPPVSLVQTSDSLGGGKLCTGLTVLLPTQCCQTGYRK